MIAALAGGSLCARAQTVPLRGAYHPNYRNIARIGPEDLAGSNRGIAFTLFARPSGGAQIDAQLLVSFFHEERVSSSDYWVGSPTLSFALKSKSGLSGLEIQNVDFILDSKFMHQSQETLSGSFSIAIDPTLRLDEDGGISLVDQSYVPILGKWGRANWDSVMKLKSRIEKFLGVDDAPLSNPARTEGQAETRPDSELGRDPKSNNRMFQEYWNRALSLERRLHREFYDPTLLQTQSDDASR